MISLLLPLLLATLALSGGGDRRPERLPRDPGPRTEYFVLELAAADAPAGARLAQPVGSVVLRRREVEGGFQLEAEWRFDRSAEEGGSEQVHHIEQIAETGSKLIWREWGPGRARSLTVERDASGREIDYADSGRGAKPRGTLAASARAFLPLELLERMRSGDAPSACERFDPLSRALERVELRLRPGSSALVRDDGTIAGRCEFVGGELRSFRWQDGDLVARRVDEKDYRARAPDAAVTIRRP